MRKSESRVISRALLVGIVCLAGGLLLHGQKPKKRGVQDISAPSDSTIQLGPYYALVIGNNDYRGPHIPKLVTAVNDANSVAQLLRDRYGFNTQILLNATRDQIFTALVGYRKTLSDNANLLIYYAGHGHLDEDAGEAYWLPIDAQSDNPEHWISANDITSNVRAVPAKHVLIISDSCYSGGLSDGGMRSATGSIDPLEHRAYLAKKLNLKSRTLMASGGLEPVADSGAGNHSVFAGALIDGLRQMQEDQFAASDLFHSLIEPRVAGRSQQLPHYDALRNSGHDLGDFIFSRGAKGIAVSPPPIKVTTIHVTDPVIDSGSGPDLPVTITNSGGKSDSDAIKAVIKIYEQAYDYRDAAALWKIWPNVSPRTKQSIEGAFQGAASIKMTVEPGVPDIAPDGATARVHGQFSQIFTPRNGSPQPRNDEIVFSLKKSRGVWTLVDVK